MKQLHRITGIIVAVFIILHLFNHSMAWFGVETHQKILDTFRSFYRIPIIEIILVRNKTSFSIAKKERQNKL
jgi:succinate dehydrogenase/fumarate reductase cytochrome b subunit